MKKIQVLFLALLSGIIFAQNTRFIYQVTMKKDSTNRNDVKSELAYLDVGSGKSFFYAEKRLKRDSIMQVMFQSGGTAVRFDRTQMDNLRSDINYSIEKDLTKQKTTYKERIARDLYSYEEDRPFNWKILPQTLKIGEYKAQKAETEFAGRKWTAWFTQDIPFMDGPFKFSGLPGLIIKIEDSKGDYAFDLKETKKLAEIPNLSERGNIIKVKRTDFVKQQEKFRKDPVSFMNSSLGAAPPPPMSASGGSFRVQGTFNGRNLNDPEMRKRMEERMKEEVKKNNNPIELK